MASTRPNQPSSKAPELDAQQAAEKRAKGKRSHGFIKLKVFYDAGPSELVVQVYEARDLRANNPKKASPYVKMYLLPDKNKKTKKKSTPRKGTLNPYWEQEFRWKLPDPQENMQRTLELTLWSKGSVGSDFMGRTAMQLADVLPPKQAKEGWFEMYDGDRGKHEYKIMEAIGESHLRYMALYDYNPRCKQELLLRQDDIINLLSEDKDWCLVQNAITQSEGYVPSSFIALAANLESEIWFFGKITRGKAEKLLMNPMRKHGCFLVRESESAPGSYSLSMRDGDSVRHFRVQTLEDDCYRLQGSPSPPFTTLPELVLYHRKKKAGLTTTLKDACPKEHIPLAPDLSYGEKDKWEIERSEIELTGVLGQGQYGEVYKGLWRGEVEVAVKTMKEDTATSADFQLEVQTMKALKHANLVQLYAVCTRGAPLFIITELMPNGDLLEFLHTKAGQDLRLPKLVDMAADVAKGMAHLELNGYIHRDLAARNILVGLEGVCKVADFGFARLVADDPNGVFKAENLTKFPVRWTAPEAMALNKYSIKSDIWSFGIMIAEVVTYGLKPYHGLSNREVVQKLDEGFRMPKPAGCPDGLFKIMLECWKTDPVDRPTFESLTFRLEDFFTSGEANYTDPKDFVDEAEDTSVPTEKEEHKRLEEPSDVGSDDDTTVAGSDAGGGGDTAAE